MELRKPIVTIMGHVDHGKTKILDTIRKSTVAEREAGAITQTIGSSIVPTQTIKKICGDLLTLIKTELTLPGLLFIDTPGHAAFTNLRKRGGNLADLAILVIDVNEGLKPQTIEAIEILKKYKTPFVIALNKVDLISGWKNSGKNMLESLNNLSEQTKELFDQKLYEVVGDLYSYGFQAERFDRITEHNKQISIVPTCAKTGEGIPELLMVLTGLAQRFLNTCLECNAEGEGRGTILEVKDVQGLGTTLDVIIYNGQIKTGDTIVIGGINEPIVTKVRSLLEPKPLSEMMDKKSKYTTVKEVRAATGIKIAAPNIEEAIAGMPILVANKNIENAKQEAQQAVDEVLIETDKDGIIIKADTLGGLEAMITLCKEQDIPIRKASVGNISKKDIIDAKSSSCPFYKVVLGFNVKLTKEGSEYRDSSNVVVLTNSVIYRLLEDYSHWKKAEEKKAEEKKLEGLTRPFKIQILKGMVFRQKSPAVVGVEVTQGTLYPKSPVMKTDGSRPGYIKTIQDSQKSVEKASKDQQVAVSIENVTIGRQINEEETLYSDITENEFRRLKECKELLTNDEVEILKEIVRIKRKQNDLWGM
ncbi:MAG: translation initiation factor IF-2 [Candidatus Nanoarchaeia archaeon]